MTNLWLDCETFSECDLKTRGQYVYAEDPSTEVMIVTYAVDNGPVRTLDLTVHPLLPEELTDLLEDDQVLVHAHNSSFDRNVFKHVLKIDIPIHRWRDTMVQGLLHGLPGALDKQCAIMRVPFDEAKDSAGKKLIQLFCKPRPKNAKQRRATRWTHPKEWADFLVYAASDITAMRAIERVLPRWNYGENQLALWFLNQRFNDRGLRVDVPFAEQALVAVAEAGKELAARTSTLTSGLVEKPTQRDVMLSYILAEHGVLLPDMKAATLERRIDDTTLPRELRELLAIRLDATTTSTSKYRSALRRVCRDGRARGTVQHSGAPRTRRDAGRGVQPQNMPRPTLPYPVIQQAIDWAMTPQGLKPWVACEVLPSVMEVMSSAVRGIIIPGPGKLLHVADLSNIEGRGAAWQANEEWKLQAFRDFDAGTGPDLYKLAYARAFNISPDQVDKAMRQIGKVMELALAYEGGVGAFLTFTMTYKLDVHQLAEAAYPILPDWARREAERFYDWTVSKKRSTFGLTRKQFVVCDALKRMWRAAHPNIVQMWKDLIDACRNAIEYPGADFPCNSNTIRRDGAWLRIIMASGNCLCYPAPRIERTGFSYMGLNQYTRQWQRIKTHGGKVFENLIQSFAGDIFKYPALDIEAAGYEPVLPVHDEWVTEASASNPPKVALADLMARPVPWAPGLPLAAAGHVLTRYGKPD